MLDEPSDELFSSLGVRRIDFLGGRLNRHWLVERSSERMVLRRWSTQPPGSIEFECRLLSRLSATGLPVAPMEDLVDIDGVLWSLARFLPGEPSSLDSSREPRARGRLLAEFHAQTEDCVDLGQRPGWRRCEEILRDPGIDATLEASEAIAPEEVRILHWHLDRARARIENLHLEDRPSQIVHGDFTTWNLRFLDGRLSGLLDFELSRMDHRVADFSLAWRGKYDEVIEGYEEVSPLDPEEKAAIVPAWWAELINTACALLKSGTWDDGWTMGKLLTWSPFMAATEIHCLNTFSVSALPYFRLETN